MNNLTVPFLTWLPPYFLTSRWPYPPPPIGDPDPVGTLSWSPPTIALTPLAATLMDLPASVANKKFTVCLSPLDATFTKTREEGSRLWLTRFPDEELCPEEYGHEEPLYASVNDSQRREHA